MRTLIQELQHLQHVHGYLSRDALESLSARNGAPLRRLHEVASFFPHFRLFEKPPAVTVQVCRDMTCHLRGSTVCREQLLHYSAEQGAERIRIEGVSCLGRCDQPLAVSINDRIFAAQSTDSIKQLIRQELTGTPAQPPAADRAAIPAWSIDPYEGQTPYAQVRKFCEMYRQWQPWMEMRRKSRAANAPAPVAVSESSPAASPAASDPNQPLDPYEWVLREMEAGNLRGMGGAGFPAHMKWREVRKNPLNDRITLQQGDYVPEAPCKYIVCNGDESEPGTFKDRELLARYPHLVLEGVILAGLITGAKQGYIYIRHEYPEQIEAVTAAIAAAYAAGVCGPNILGTDLSFELAEFVSPGGYICGEQSALLAAMMDQRAEPKNKGVSVTQEGLYGQPTVVNNVETLAWVPAIAARGGAWYAGQARRGGKGKRFVSISGDLARPGVYEVPFGITLGELIEEFCGGMRDGLPLTAAALSGPSGGFLPATLNPQKLSRDGAFADLLVKLGLLPDPQAQLDLRNLPLDWDLLRGTGIMLGAAHVIYGGPVNLFNQALNCVEFYRNESCGKCVPCRLGTQKLATMLGNTLADGHKLDQELVLDLAVTMDEASICGLGQVAANSIKHVFRYFESDLRARERIS